MGILKFRIGELGTNITDLEYLTKTAPVDEFSSFSGRSSIRGICTDGTHVFELWNTRVTKYLCSDMSVVDWTVNFNGSDDFAGSEGVTTHGAYLFITDNTGGQGRVVVLQKSDLAYVGEFNTDVYMAQGISHDDTRLYVALTPLLG